MHEVMRIRRHSPNVKVPGGTGFSLFGLELCQLNPENPVEKRQAEVCPTGPPTRALHLRSGRWPRTLPSSICAAGGSGAEW